MGDKVFSFDRLLNLIAMSVGVVIFSFSNFQTKEESRKMQENGDKTHAALDKRITDVDTRSQARIDNLERLMGQVAADTSYLRGRMEPKR